MSCKSPLKVLNERLQRREALRQHSEEQHETSRKLEARRTLLLTERAKIEETMLNEVGLAFLESREPSAESVSLRAEILRIDKEIEPLPAAVQISLERHREHKRALFDAEQEVANAAFKLASEIRRKSAQAVMDLMDKAEPHLAAMAMADNLGKLFTGVQPIFSIDGPPDEFSGSFVANKLIGGLTHFTRPQSLTDENFKSAVDNAAAELTAQATKGIEE